LSGLKCNDCGKEFSNILSDNSFVPSRKAPAYVCYNLKGEKGCTYGVCYNCYMNKGDDVLGGRNKKKKYEDN